MQGKGLRIKLRFLAPELAALPWEFMFDSQRSEYLCFSRQTPVVRYPTLPESIQPLAITPPLRILGMVANPRGLTPLDSRSEKERLSQPLQKPRQAGLVELHWLEGETWRDLQRAMRRGPWHVFHFIGHGGFDAQRGEGFLALSDEQGERLDLRATQLARLMADHPSLRLAVLNACEGGRSSQLDVFSSTASILLRGGVPAVLAMQYAISDLAALEFTRTFYESMADGLSVDAAVVEGRVAISLAFTDTIEWGTPILYLRSEDGILFNVAKTAALPLSEASAEVVLPQPVDFSQPALSRSNDQVQNAAPRQQSQRRQPVPPKPSIDARLLHINKAWLAIAAVGVIVLCLLLTVISGIPQAILAGLSPPPVATQTQPAPAALAAAKDTPTQAVHGQTPAFTPTPPRKMAETLAARGTPFTPLEDQTAPQDGMPLVFIPAGEFQMGCDPEHNMGLECNYDELPLHTVYLDAYWIDRTEVTNAMYAKCVAAGACQMLDDLSSYYVTDYFGNPEFADYPLTHVSWLDATAYCAWAGRRLPSEAEWEKAARGAADTRAFPWGDALPNCDIANFASFGYCSREPLRESSKVGSFPEGASPYGVLDMAGNVEEMVNDFSENYFYETSPKNNPTGPETGEFIVLRGGSWGSYISAMRVADRYVIYPDDRSHWDLGFRCAASALP